MKVYLVWADVFHAPYGCEISVFGIYSTEKLAEQSVEKLKEKNRKGVSGWSLDYYITEVDMNKCDEIYLGGYYE